MNDCPKSEFKDDRHVLDIVTINLCSRDHRICRCRQCGMVRLYQDMGRTGYILIGEVKGEL